MTACRRLTVLATLVSVFGAGALQGIILDQSCFEELTSTSKKARLLA